MLVEKLNLILLRARILSDKEWNVYSIHVRYLFDQSITKDSVIKI